jgi:hypothetical protein
VSRKKQRSDLTAPIDGLTPKEAALVRVTVEAASDGIELTREQAGTLAGYGTGEVARASASRAFGRPEVRSALMKAMREVAGVDAAASYALLRHVSSRGRSERTRVDAALAVARIGGLDTPQVVGGGAGVVLNLQIGGGAGTLLAQRMAMVPQPLMQQGFSGGAQPLIEGMRADQAEAPPAPPRPKAAAKRGVGGKTGASVPSTSPPRNSPPKTPRAKK